MKKIFCYSLLTVLVILTGCRNEDELFGQKFDGNYQVNAQLESRADSRTAVNDVNQVLWLESDKIGVYGDKGSSNVAFSIGQISDEGASATFVGDLKEGEVATTVYYPYDETATLSGNQLTFTLPAEYDYTANSNAPMIGVKQENGSFLFKHLCGLLKFSIMDIPADAARLIVASRGDAAPLIAGSCVVDDITANGAVFSIKEGFDQIVINMDGITGTQTFYVPIPVGSYPEIQVTLEKQDGTTCFSEKLSDVLVQRATIVRVSDDLVDTDKSVEEFIKTSNDKDIYVFMSELEKILKTNENIYEYEIDLAGSEIIYKDGSKQILIFSYDENAFKYSMPSIPKEESTYDWIADVEEIDGFSLISSVDTRASDEDGIFQNTKILRWAPYQDELGVGLDLNTLVAKSPINFTIIGNYANREATSTRLNDNLSEAGIIDIETHGYRGEILIPFENIDRGAYQGQNDNVIIIRFTSDRHVDVKYEERDKSIGVPLETFKRYSFCKDGIIFNNSCESVNYESEQTLKELLINKGISTYTGYSNITTTFDVQYFMDKYTNELCYNLKSNVESIPYDSKYIGQMDSVKIDSVTKDTIGYYLKYFEAYFDVTTSKEMRFVDFEPEQEAEVTETEISFPFYLKGVRNLKDDCKVRLLISDKNEVDEEITNANIKNYAISRPYSIGEFSDNASYYNIKGDIEYIKGSLDESGVGSTGTKYYWICLEYKGRYWISDEYGTFVLGDAGEDAMREYLVKLYHDTDGDNWERNDNWLSDKPITEWYGVSYIVDRVPSMELEYDFDYPDEGYCLDLDDNNLKGAVDLSGCPLIWSFSAEENELTSVDVSNCTSLCELLVRKNMDLEKIDISNTTITDLYCNDDYFPSLKTLIAENSKLHEFTCYSPLEVFQFSGGSVVVAKHGISCNEGAIIKLFDPLFNQLDLSGSKLGEVMFVNAQFSDLNLSGCQFLGVIRVPNSIITNLNVSNCQSIKGGIDVTDSEISNFDFSNCDGLEELLMSFDRSEISKLNLSGCDKLYSVSFDKQCAVSELNLSDCPNLNDVLIHKSCHLEALDVSRCIRLTSISLYPNNLLTTLDVSTCPNLVRLYCPHNSLISINASGCSKLLGIDCSFNSLTSLNVSGCSDLRDIDCSYNQLTDLDVSDCVNLEELDCMYNKITKEIPAAFKRLSLFYHDRRYEYHSNGTYTDNGVGWWYPGEPESGKHAWPDE